MKKVFTLLLAGALCSSMVWADYSITMYRGTLESKKDTTVANKEGWEAVLATYPNAVAVIDGNVTANATFAKSTKNIIAHYYGKVPDSNVTYDNYSCPNLMLVDLITWAAGSATMADTLAKAAKTDFYSPVDFKATTGSYTRHLYKGYNSVCVPFQIALSDFNYHEVMSYNSYWKSENNAKFMWPIEDISAGSAVIIDLAAEKDWTVTFNKTLIKGSPVEGSAFHGVFKTTDCSYATTGLTWYSVSDQNDYFSPIASNLYPFRASFTLTGDTHNVSPRLVVMESEEATNLNEVNAAQQDGKFFQNGKLMIRHNGQVFDAAGKIVK